MDEVQSLFGDFLRVAINYANKMYLGEVPYDAESWILIRRIFDDGFGAKLPDHPSELKEPLAISFGGKLLDRIS